MRVRVWDLPTRLFHGALAICFAGLVATGKSGGDWMRWHFLLGQAVLALLLFRLVWGWVGGYWSRFNRFLPKPLAALRYLKTPRSQPGHNPMGAFSVWAFLCLLLLQSFTGLISDDEIASTGPLSHLVSGSWVSRASSWHIGWGLNLLLTLVAIHLLAIIFYQFVKRQALVQAMVHGDQVHDGQYPASEDSWLSRLKAALILLACALLVGGLVLRYGN